MGTDTRQTIQLFIELLIQEDIQSKKIDPITYPIISKKTPVPVRFKFSTKTLLCKKPQENLAIQKLSSIFTVPN